MGGTRQGRSLTQKAETAAGVASPGSLNGILFWPFWWGTRILLRLCLRLRVEGELPKAGSVVLAANHASFLDPLLLGAASKRRIVYLMTEVVWRSPFLHWFYRWNSAIPLSTRGANREAMRRARCVLEQQRVVGIFPEGGLSRDGLPLLGNAGAVSLVLSEGVPIVPVGIIGAAAVLPFGCRWPRLRRVTIRFGAPITAAELQAAAGGDRRARLRAATTMIMARIGALTGQEPREAEMRRLQTRD